MDKYRSLHTVPSNKNITSDYEHHLRRLSEIRSSSKHKFDEGNSMAQLKTLQKWKQTAKHYEALKQDTQLKKQNHQFLQRLWKISVEKPLLSQQKKFQTTQLQIRHRQINKKRFIQKIDSQNQILARNLVQQSKNVKSKSQIRQQMKEYLFRRIKLRKVLSPEEIENFKKRSKSHTIKSIAYESPRSKKQNTKNE